MAKYTRNIGNYKLRPQDYIRFTTIDLQLEGYFVLSKAIFRIGNLKSNVLCFECKYFFY
jgi:hypothetical protein